MSSRKAVKFGSGNTGKDDIDFEVSDNEWEEVKEEEEEEEDNWEESEAVQMIRESDLVVLRSGDEFSPVCVARICPELPVTETLRRKKQTTLYQVTSEIDGILSGLVVGTY